MYLFVKETFAELDTLYCEPQPVSTMWCALDNIIQNAIQQFAVIGVLRHTLSKPI